MAAFSGPVDELVTAGYPFPDHGTVVDVAMMTVVTGHGRGPSELDALFTRAGLRRTRILPTPSFASIVEAEAMT
ncbi:hypothetical protein [Streptomyces sp. NPDC053048]|uniref:hypothetical protein n=1 Tax=Streptomyces sp. NPDC053048 TaxID=3365694 RepID=UPI0037D810B8